MIASTIRILLAGLAVLALSACSQGTKEKTNDAAASAADDSAANMKKAGDAVDNTARDAGNAVDAAGDKAAAAAAKARQDTGKAVEKAGQDMQKPS